MTAALALSATLPNPAGVIVAVACVGLVVGVAFIVSGLRDKQKERDGKPK